MSFKAVYNIPTTRILLDRLNLDIVFRRVCGGKAKMNFTRDSYN